MGTVLEGRTAVLESEKNSTFMDVACGVGPASSEFVYSVTSTGLLCCFGPSRGLERFVNLKVTRGFALSVSEQYIAIGCADGFARLFEASSLAYVATLPKPCALGKTHLGPNKGGGESSTDVFPDCIALRFVESLTRLHCRTPSHSLSLTSLADYLKIPSD